MNTVQKMLLWALVGAILWIAGLMLFYAVSRGGS